MIYTEKDLVRVAKRDNNKKRGYLVVDPLQGKHVPAVPTKALNLFKSLSEHIKNKYDNDKILVIGFAETATAIGAQVAIELEARYIQTTREVIEGVEYLFFSEAHSHATEQKLVKDDIDIALECVDRIIFVEDEVTTGNTIMNIINLLCATYDKKIDFTILSLLNGMDEDAIKRCESRNIDIHYVLKTDHSEFESRADVYATDGDYIEVDNKANDNYRLWDVNGYLNARRLVGGRDYVEACQLLWEGIKDKLDIANEENILVVGTEEFMYPALYVGAQLEGIGCGVRCHSTTRSPIAVSNDSEYPLHTRYELESVYDTNRVTYIYDIERYDRVIVITDSQVSDKGMLNSLINAIQKNNEKIEVVRWN